MALNGLKEAVYIVTVERLHFERLHAWRLARGGRIDADVVQLHGLLEGFVKNAMDILDGLGAQWRIALLQAIDESFHGWLGKRGQLHRPNLGSEDLLCMALVQTGRAFFEVTGILRKPHIQPSAHGDFSGLHEYTRVHLSGDPAQLLRDFLLRFAVHRLAYLLAGTRIGTECIHALPAPVRAHADGAGAPWRCVACSSLPCPNPSGDIRRIHLPVGNGQGQGDNLLLGVADHDLIHYQDQAQHADADPLIAVNKTMVLYQPTGYGSGLVLNGGMRVLTSKGGHEAPQGAFDEG